MGLAGRAPRRRRGGARHRRAHLRVHPSERGEGVVRERRGGARSHLEGGDRAARRAARVPRRARKRAKDTRLTRRKSRAVRAAQFRHQLMTRNSRLVLAALRISTSGVVGRHSRARARPASGPARVSARVSARGASSACRGPPPAPPARGAPPRAPRPLVSRSRGRGPSPRASPSARGNAPALEARCAAQARRLLRVVALDPRRLRLVRHHRRPAPRLLQAPRVRARLARARRPRVHLPREQARGDRGESATSSTPAQGAVPQTRGPRRRHPRQARIDVADRDVEAIAAAETLSSGPESEGEPTAAAATTTTTAGNAFEPTKSLTTPRSSAWVRAVPAAR